MRYLLHASQSFEIPNRQPYLYKVFHLYFLPRKPERNNIPLVPLGKCDLDILFITGHTDKVNDYLENMIQTIPEKTIVITSCKGSAFQKYAASKNIFVPKQKTPFCEIHDGAPYGFGFKISDPELDFYNAKGSIEDKLLSVYYRLT